MASPETLCPQLGHMFALRRADCQRGPMRHTVTCPEAVAREFPLLIIGQHCHSRESMILQRHQGYSVMSLGVFTTVHDKKVLWKRRLHQDAVEVVVGGTCLRVLCTLGAVVLVLCTNISCSPAELPFWSPCHERVDASRLPSTPNSDVKKSIQCDRQYRGTVVLRLQHEVLW